MSPCSLLGFLLKCLTDHFTVDSLLISLDDSISLALFVIALMSTRNYTNVIFGKFRLLCVDSSPASDWSQTLLNSPSYWLSVTLPTFLVMRGLACYHGTPLYLSVSEIMKSSESNVTQCCHSRPPALTGDQVLRARPAK